MTPTQQSNSNTVEDIRKTLSQPPEKDGAVYLLPDLKDSFLSFSWFVVLPDGTVRMNRWEPQEREEVNLVRENDLSPATKPLHMWKTKSVDNIIEDHIKPNSGRISEIVQVGTIQSVDETLMFNLNNPDKHTGKQLDRL